ncbi:subclass B3 metallo-beta-lactamase [Sphingomonas sp. CGMCC 1.13654]|uniref:Subclass B3 metallo-beta-lactamase n=1 Tax=Sphingomonas chungangi TaxID=2683589 RepID=A0A838L2H7_9SPHN|nr:subclass B3 metallo-beta-lactamase [Sphingomonas chungangi]MVW54718.1 subclass B3 metallo-beta-lactamase [Sphingomonas chungangi]
MLLGSLMVMPAAAGAPDPPEWTQPIAPFHLIGPIDYVGSKGIAAYLIHTSMGAILIDGTMEANADMVRRNIETMGVPIREVKWIVVTHAHFDHAGAVAALAKMSGAQVVAGAGDVEALERGGSPGEVLYTPTPYPPVHVDKPIHDHDWLVSGDRALVAHSTPGHTPGCTSWAMFVPYETRNVRVVFPCSVTVAGNRLVGNTTYPGIVADFRKSFDTLGALKADVVLPAHPEIADVIGRAQRGELIDPALLGQIVAQSRVDFEAELQRQSKAK